MKLLVNYQEIPTKPPEWLIKNLITANSLCGVFSPTGLGKTFVVLDMGFAVATGLPFHGHETKKGAVVIIAGEGHGGLKKRIRAKEITSGMSLDDNFLISSQPIPLNDFEWITNLQTAIDESNLKPILIIVDTLARNFKGDENSTQDMGRFINGLDLLRVKYRCAVLVVHHTGHSQKDRSRGSSSFKAALDHEFKVSRNPETKIIKLISTKTKDFEAPSSMAFKLVTTETDISDEDGNYVKSAVLQQVDYTEPEAQPPKPAGKNQKMILELLDNLIAEQELNVIASGRDPGAANVSVSDWRDECLKSGIANNRFFEAKNSLIDLGVISIDDPYVVRIRPKTYRESDFRINKSVQPTLSEKPETVRNGQEPDKSDYEEKPLELDIF